MAERWAHMTRAERVLTVVALVNFLAAFVITWWLGGAALQGMTENGRYMVGNHGRFREVTPGQYFVSLFQVLSIFITHPLAMYASRRGRRRAMEARKPGS